MVKIGSQITDCISDAAFDKYLKLGLIHVFPYSKDKPKKIWRIFLYSAKGCERLFQRDFADDFSLL